MHPEGGDPNDFMARIEPAGGEGPLAVLDLAERFFGPSLAASPGEASLRASREKAQRALPAALAHWSATRPGGSLLVRLPFPMAGDCDAGAPTPGAGTESMWVDVTSYDARTIKGKLVDDPLGATQFNRGDAITRPRSEVEDDRDARPMKSRLRARRRTRAPRPRDERAPPTHAMDARHGTHARHAMQSGRGHWLVEKVPFSAEHSCIASEAVNVGA